MSQGQSFDHNRSIEKIINKSMKTSTYHSIEYSEEGKEISESMGYSNDIWELVKTEEKLTLILKNQGELMETFNISNTRFDEEGILVLESDDKKTSFWFFDEYLLTKSHQEISSEIEHLLGYNSTWFYYN